jgi:hypothetical protein
MNIAFQAPMRVMNIGMGHDWGFMLVPDAWFISNVSAAFMVGMFSMPGICEWSMPGICE